MSLELQNSLLPSHSHTEVSIQEILKVYFQNVINQIGFYEEKTRTEISHLKQSIETKDQLIQSSTEMNSKLKEEMQDFLKVSFANKWKVESEKLKLENGKLKEELKIIKKENTNLNQCIEKYLKEKEEKEKEEKENAASLNKPECIKKKLSVSPVSSVSTVSTVSTVSSVSSVSTPSPKNPDIHEFPELPENSLHSVSATQQNTSVSTSSIETQTEYICIQTQKAKYTLVDDSLMNGDKVIGKVIV